MSDRAGHGLPIAFSCLLEILVFALTIDMGGLLPTQVREAKRSEDFLSGPMEAGRPGGAFGPKPALFPCAVADLPGGGTDGFA